MKTYKNLYQTLYSKENLILAFQKAQKRKSNKNYVIKFKENLEENLELLRLDLLQESYKPKPLKTFIIRDPKTRKIRKSYFIDRVVHHAICNILEPIFEKRFIYDSFANRKGKGTLNAINRFDKFKLKASKNNTRKCYVLKADIKHYFDEVNQQTLINIIKKKIKDKQLISLINKVLKNHSDKIGMPLGNQTSQFFANVYLNELDQFVKNELKAKYYIRYVDDFIILHNNKQLLEKHKQKISNFLNKELQLELHKTKSKVIPLNKGILFLGFRIFYYHKLLRKANIITMKKKLLQTNYDKVYEFLEGWCVYASQGNTYNLRNKIIKSISKGRISIFEIDRWIKFKGVGY